MHIQTKSNRRQINCLKSVIIFFFQKERSNSDSKKFSKNKNKN